MRWRGILREGDSGTKTSPPIHLRVRAPKGITEPVDGLDLGILGSYKALSGRQERRAIVRQERPGSRYHVVPRLPKFGCRLVAYRLVRVFDRPGIPPFQREEHGCVKV